MTSQLIYHNNDLFAKANFTPLRLLRKNMKALRLFTSSARLAFKKNSTMIEKYENWGLAMKQSLRFMLLSGCFIAIIWLYNHFTAPGPLGDSFSLVASNGRTVSEKDLRAKPAAIFFGFTHCADICPTTLFDMNHWQEQLGDDADKLQVWFVTVDPERDTPQVMADYLSNFAPRVVGISGKPEAVHEMVKSFKIVAEKVDMGDGNHSYDHTAAIILLKKGGQRHSIIPYGEQEEIALERLKNLIKES